MTAPAPHSDWILTGLALLLLLSMTAGAARGARRGPLRQLAALAGLVAALILGGTIGPAIGHALFSGIGVPWILRGILGAMVTGAAVWLPVFASLWWRGRSRAPGGEPDRPVLGAIIGCWTGLLGFAVGLLPVLALGAVGEIFQGDKGNTPAPRPLRWAMHVRHALAERPVTAPLAAVDPLPPGFRRLLTKGLAVLRNRAAFRRLQADEEVRALAASPAFYPLVNDPEINALVKRRDMGGLMTHPRVSALLADDEFQQRLASTDLEPMLDRALNTPPESGGPAE